MNNILIAYFSRRGENYVNAKIESLTIGNSEYIAKMIEGQYPADIFEIRGVDAYPKDYHETTQVAQEEYNENKRPILTDTIANMDQYDTIILGYPNWWGTMPMGVFTFLESYDFTNKTILPFCTHEGSGMANSEQDIKRICPSANVLKGLPIKGSLVKTAQKEVQAWLTQHGIKD